MLEIGAGLTNVAIYKDKSLQYLNAYPMAGNDITTAIANSFDTSIETAQKLKANYSCIIPDLLENPEEIIPIYSIRANKDNPIELGEFSAMVSDFYQQMLKAIKNQIQEDYPLDDFSQYGIVITGGSSAAIGITELTSEIFDNATVRLGEPNNQVIKSLPADIQPTQLSKICGLMIYANQIYFQNQTHPITSVDWNQQKSKIARNQAGENWLQKLKNRL